MKLAERLGRLGIEGAVRAGAPLCDFTSYRIGGPAEVLVEPASIADVAMIVAEAARAGAPLRVIGAGSNVLAPDEGLDGVVVRIGERMGAIRISDGIIEASAGTSDRDLALAAARAGFTGFEFLEDIPGTVGGGLVQNAEAWGDSICDHVLDVTTVGPGGAVEVIPAHELHFAYRDSTFKLRRSLVIVMARFRSLGRDTPEAILARIDSLRLKRAARYPLDLPSCGSVFKRPASDFPGRLIEQVGLGGYSCGRATVSRKHHNFIVNLGGATARDIKTLVELIRVKVKNEFGVDLQRELIYLEEDCKGRFP